MYRMKFVHPTTGATFEADINPELTADEVVTALISEGFIEPPKSGQYYGLGINGGRKISGTQTMAEGGAADDVTVNMVLEGVGG